MDIHNQQEIEDNLEMTLLTGQDLAEMALKFMRGVLRK